MEDTNQKLYTPIYEPMLKLKLSPAELLVYALIYDCQDKTCYMNNAQIAEEYNISAKTVSRILKRLEELKLIHIEKKSSGRIIIAIHK